MNQGRSRRRMKTVFLVIFGVTLGGVFLYIAFRGVTWSDLIDGVLEMRPVYMIHATVILLIIQLVRALRFRLIVSPFCKLSLKDSWDLINIWGGLNMVLPARLGEFVKPYFLSRRGVSFSSSIGAVMVERFFDMTALITLLALILWLNPNLPGTYKWTGGVLFCILAAGYVMVLIVLTNRETIISLTDRLLGLLPKRIGSFLTVAAHKLIDGFLIMAGAKQALALFIYSMLLWLLFSAMTYVFLLAFSLEVPFLAAVTIQVLLCLGVALPSAPGFIGAFHAIGRYALQLFGVGAVIAISFATVYHLYTVVSSLILAGISYVTGSFRFDRSIGDLADSVENESESELTEAAPTEY